MFTFIGYQQRHKEKGFSFILPLFEKDKLYYRSINEPHSGRILSFKEIYIQPEIFVSFTNDKMTFQEGDLALYGFHYQEKIFIAYRSQINRHLIETLQYGKLSLLEKYDVYFFWGDFSNIQKHVKAFVKIVGQEIISQENFVRPEIVMLKNEEIAECLYQISEILSYRQTIFDYSHMFAINGKNIRFLHYEVKRTDLITYFDTLIHKYKSPFYRDLIVHCYIQTNLLNGKIKSKNEIVYRELLPMNVTENIISQEPFPIDPNSPIVAEDNNYSMEATTKAPLDTWEELLIRNTSTLTPKMNALEWLEHLHNLKKKEINNDESDVAPILHPIHEQKLAERIRKIKEEMA